MSIGVESINVDTDLIFAAYTTGRTRAAATGLTYGSSKLDLNQRYENLIYGTAAAATGIETKITGTDLDLNQFFCKLGTDWTASLPTFPNAFTTSPQNGIMTVTLSGGPSGTYTYDWTSTSTGAATFTINSGQGTATINWTATGVSAEPGIITVTCTVTATNTASVSATTSMKFNIAGGG